MAILEPTGQPSSALLVLCACPHSFGERGPGCWCAFIPGACWDELWQTGNDPSLSPLFSLSSAPGAWKRDALIPYLGTQGLWYSWPSLSL